MKVTSILASIFLLMTILGCVGDEGSGIAINSGSRATAGQDILLTVNGEGIIASELISAPEIRFALGELVLRKGMQQLVEREGIELDEDDFNQKIAQWKEQMVNSRVPWSESLDGDSLTEDEFVANVRLGMQMEQLIKKRANVTDEVLRKYWEQGEEEILDAYVRRFSLPEEDRSSVTFDDAKETIEMMIIADHSTELMSEIREEVVVQAQVALPCIPDEEIEQQLISLIKRLPLRARKSTVDDTESVVDLDLDYTTDDLAESRPGDADDSEQPDTTSSEPTDPESSVDPAPGDNLSSVG
jgi:hypothetical protein